VRADYPFAFFSSLFAQTLPKENVGPCSLPQNLVVPLPALGKKGGAVIPPTLLVAALPKAGIVELVALSTLEIDIPSLQGAPGALLPLE